MKAFSFEKFGLAILVLASALLIASIKAIECKYTNIYLEIFERRSRFTLYDQPQFNSTNCAPEWGTHGTCCQDENIDGYGRYKVKENALLIANRELEMETFVQKLKNFTERYCVLNTTDNSCQDLNSEEKFLALSVGTYNNFTKKIKPFLTSIPLAFDKINAAKAACDQKIFHYKLAAVCPICSGRAANFFSAGKLLMNELDCNDIITTCFDFWKLLYDGLVKGKQYLYNFKYYSQSMMMQPDEAQFVTPKFYYLYKWMSVTLRNYVKNCSTPDCGFNMTSVICSSIVHIVDPTNGANRSLASRQLRSSSSRGLGDRAGGYGQPLVASRGNWGKETSITKGQHNCQDESCDDNHPRELQDNSDHINETSESSTTASGESTTEVTIETSTSSSDSAFSIVLENLAAGTLYEVQAVTQASCASQTTMDNVFGPGTKCAIFNLTLFFA